MAEDAIEKDTRQIASTLQLPKADVDHCRVLANPAVHPDLATIFGSCEGAAFTRLLRRGRDSRRGDPEPGGMAQRIVLATVALALVVGAVLAAHASRT